MRKLVLLPLLLLLVACGSATAPEVTTAPENADSSELAVEDNPAGETASEEIPAADEASQDGKYSVVTGATPQEAGIVREQDHTKGTEDPTVTIIEYGDFQ